MRKPEIINESRNACKCCQNKEESIKSGKDKLKAFSTILFGIVFLGLLLLFLPWKDIVSYRGEKLKETLTTEQALFLRIVNDSCYVKVDSLECGNQKAKERNDTCLVKLMSDYLSSKVDTLVSKAVEEKRHELIDSVKRAFLHDSVSVYLTSIIQTEERYKVYYMIYRIHFENVNKYALCRILKFTRKRDRDINEIRFMGESGSLMDLVFQSEPHHPQE